MNKPFPRVPLPAERSTTKPRRKGLTMMLDRGLLLGEQADWLNAGRCPGDRGAALRPERTGTDGAGAVRVTGHRSRPTPRANDRIADSVADAFEREFAVNLHRRGAMATASFGAVAAEAD